LTSSTTTTGQLPTGTSRRRANESTVAARDHNGPTSRSACICSAAATWPTCEDVVLSVRGTSATWIGSMRRT
jgi:hypothetical protein